MMRFQRNNQSENNTSGSDDSGVTIDDVKNLYESSIAIEDTWGTEKNANYPDFEALKEEFGSNPISDSGDLQKILEKIESETGNADLFEFDKNGQNSNGASEQRSINNDGTLTEQSCPKTGAKKCTCKVTDGFENIDELFNALASS